LNFFTTHPLQNPCQTPSRCHAERSEASQS